MNNKIIELEKYKTNLQNKNELDNGNITLDELSIEELDGVIKLYKDEIKYYTEDIKLRLTNIERLEKENKRLRKLLGGGDYK